MLAELLHELEEQACCRARDRVRHQREGRTRIIESARVDILNATTLTAERREAELGRASCAGGRERARGGGGARRADGASIRGVAGVGSAKACAALRSPLASKPHGAREVAVALFALPAVCRLFELPKSVRWLTPQLLLVASHLHLQLSGRERRQESPLGSHVRSSPTRAATSCTKRAPALLSQQQLKRSFLSIPPRPISSRPSSWCAPEHGKHSAFAPPRPKQSTGTGRRSQPKGTQARHQGACPHHTKREREETAGVVVITGQSRALWATSRHTHGKTRRRAPLPAAPPQAKGPLVKHAGRTRRTTQSLTS